MSLLDQGSVVSQSIKDKITSLYDNITVQHAAIFNAVWSDPNNTPQSIMTSLGADAATLFDVSSKLQALALEINPSYVVLNPPSQYTITINQDGTVTITG